MDNLVDSLLLGINDLRSRREGYLANAVFTRTAMEKLLSSNPTVYRGDGLICVLVDDESVHRLSFFASSPDALFGVSRFSLPFATVADLVKKTDVSSPAIGVLKECGFSLYATFVRLSRPGVAGCWRGDCLRLAEKRDVDGVYQRIMSAFDPLTAHMPSRQEVLAAINAGDVIIRHSGDGSMIGFAWFETISPRSSCLRYLVTDSSLRGNGTGSLMVKAGLKKSGEQSRVHLWVDRANPALKLYGKLGFVEDGVEDLIFLYGKETNE